MVNQLPTRPSKLNPPLALFELLNDVYTAADDRHQDIAAAFDTISRSVLLRRLQTELTHCTRLDVLVQLSDLKGT